MKRAIYMMILMLAAALPGCSRNDTNPVPVQLSLSVHHAVDGASVYADSLIYENEANEQYSISRLQYYLSSFRFYRSGKLQHSNDTILLVNVFEHMSPVTLGDLMSENVDSMAVLIGISADRNIHGSLPPTETNIEMEWPEVMGGGYHFLKLEGHWRDGPDLPGFAVHVGNNNNIIEAGCRIDPAFISQAGGQLKLQMNISEWFRQPDVYSFEQDGGYTMGDSLLMAKIRRNGADVFRQINEP